MADTVLIVDDDEAVLTMLYKVIRSNGIEADTVASGEEALERTAQRTYDLILLDVMLPKLDGLEVARRLRSGSKRVDQRRSVSVDAGAAVENQNLL